MHRRRSRPVPLHVAVLHRRQMDALFEYAPKVGDAFEADLLGYVHDGQIRIEQQ